MHTSHAKGPIVTLHRRVILALVLVCSLPTAARAGFQIQRLELTPPGSWLTTVDSPWYSSTRYVAAGLALDYAHNPLVLNVVGADGGVSSSTAVVSHQLTGRVEVAGAFLDRVLLSASLPVALYERGTPLAGVAPIGGPVVGDPRVGILVRLAQHAERDAVSLHLGASVWIPVGAEAQHAGDTSVRVLPRVVLAGLFLDQVRWAATVGYLLRSSANIGPEQGEPGNLAGQELQIGGALAWTNRDRTFTVGPELQFASTTSRNDAFGARSTALEALLGAHVLVARTVMVGAAAGVGFLAQPGTPDARGLLTIAYAPVREQPRATVAEPAPAPAPVVVPVVTPPAPPAPPVESAPPIAEAPAPPPPDRDQDSVPDASDACPDQPGAPDAQPARNGCPGAVVVRACALDIAHPVYFATDRDIILRASDDVLEAVANALRLAPQIKHVSVEGHTDSMGGRAHNLDLSARRARSVVDWLVAHGVEGARLESRGFGPDRPIAENRSAAGREKNRRVDFRILDEQCRD